jgi:hypothetical protein
VGSSRHTAVYSATVPTKDSAAGTLSRADNRRFVSCGVARVHTFRTVPPPEERQEAAATKALCLAYPDLCRKGEEPRTDLCCLSAALEAC